MMLDRLIAELGRPLGSGRQAQAQVQLAAAILLFSVLPADQVVRPEESNALLREIRQLFTLSSEKAKKLIGRASAAYRSDMAIFASATFLKLKTGEGLRHGLLASAMRISLSDGECHAFEIDLIERFARLLNVPPTGMRNVA